MKEKEIFEQFSRETKDMHGNVGVFDIFAVKREGETFIRKGTRGSGKSFTKFIKNGCCEHEKELKELSVNINYCPYCGSRNISRKNGVDCYCDDCGSDFTIMTHE